ncbi:MAG: TetR/AcrR family transcriptional regulator [Deltaproteobacteria bacterium]|nr:TetR/AcrR family transcriptional regulator [Deltaproteobacteria bacterium]
MGRPSRYGEAEILDGAKQVSAEIGPQKLTIAKVAARAGVPVGSIYHRYASRDEILAAVWLDFVEDFQRQFLAELEGREVLKAGLAAVRFACGWVRGHPREARLLLLHRREDFASERWPASDRRRAEKLAADAGDCLGAYARRLAGRTGVVERNAVRLALVDLPMAGLRRDVEGGQRPSPDMQRLLLKTCAYVLRQAARSRNQRRKGRSGNGS